MEIKRVVGYLMKDPEKGIIWWRKEPKTTLIVGSIIPKVDMDNQVPGAINPCEAVTYIDALHAIFLRSRRSAGSFFITIFGAAFYYKSKI